MYDVLARQNIVTVRLGSFDRRQFVKIDGISRDSSVDDC